MGRDVAAAAGDEGALELVRTSLDGAVAVPGQVIVTHLLSVTGSEPYLLVALVPAGAAGGPVARRVQAVDLLVAYARVAIANAALAGQLSAPR